MVLEQREDRAPVGTSAGAGRSRSPSWAAGRSRSFSQPRHWAPTSRSSGERLLDAVLEQLGGRDLARVVALPERQVAAREQRLEPIDEGQLVGQAELDVDPLDALGVLAHRGRAG